MHKDFPSCSSQRGVEIHGHQHHRKLESRSQVRGAPASQPHPTQPIGSRLSPSTSGWQTQTMRCPTCSCRWRGQCVRSSPGQGEHGGLRKCLGRLAAESKSHGAPLGKSLPASSLGFLTCGTTRKWVSHPGDPSSVSLPGWFQGARDVMLTQALHKQVLPRWCL